MIYLKINLKVNYQQCGTNAIEHPRSRNSFKLHIRSFIKTLSMTFGNVNVFFSI